jgi:hypothetical protein
MDAAEVTNVADLYRQPEDYDFQESIECDLGICHCDWYNSMNTEDAQEEYILESLRDRSWADPLDMRALRIRRRSPSRKINLPMPYLDCSTVDRVDASLHL